MLGPCVQDPAWVKMNSPTPALQQQQQQKKRKKSGSKPHTQINKCLNEKRRRKQENAYFEELAELIQASLDSDMNSLSTSSKADKTAILLQTVDKIKQINETEGIEGAVQQGEVSSSKQTLIEKHWLANFVLDALDGFLFLLSPERKIEFVTENVFQYLKYNPDDLVGKDIYNIVHVGDTKKFSSDCINGWPSDSTSNSESSRSRIFTCRLLVKQPDDQGETMEEKQQRPQYESMQISTVLSSNYFGERGEPVDSHEGEGQQYFVCIARRTPVNENVEQFTTKMDSNSTILEIDHSGLTGSYAQFITKDLIHKRFTELCHPEDVTKLNHLLQEATLSGQSMSDVRLKLGSEHIVHIQSKFKYIGALENCFIATHSIKSSLQEGSSIATPTTSLLDEALGSCNDLGSTTIAHEGSKQPRRRMLTPNNIGTPDGMTDKSSSEGGPTQPQQQNKILKGLLDHKSDDEDPLLSPTTNILNRYCTPPPGHLHPQQQQQGAPSLPIPNNLNHPEGSVKNSGGSNSNPLLKDLLKGDDEEKQIKEELEDLHYGLINEGKNEIKQEVLQNWELEDKGMKNELRQWGGDLKEEKFNIKSEYRSCVTSASPMSAGLAIQQSVGMSPSPPSNSSGTSLSSFSSTSPSYSLIKNTSPFASFATSSTQRPPSRPSSTEFQSGLTSNMIRGTKRPSDEGHNGNPNKLSFGDLLDSPTTSPTSGPPLGGPPTPLQRPNTPLTLSSTMGRPNTPLNSGGRPTTPHGSAGLSMPQNPTIGSLHVGPPLQGGALSPSPIAAPLSNHSQSGSPTLSVPQQQKYQTQQHLIQNLPQMQQQQQQQLFQHHQQQQQQQSQLQQQQPKSKSELIRKLLETTQDSQMDLNNLSKFPSPYALPQEKLQLKSFNEKQNQQQLSSSASPTSLSSTPSAANNQNSDILNQLLSSQRPTPRTPKINNSVMGNQMMRAAGDHGQQHNPLIQQTVVQQPQHFQQRQQQSTLGMQNQQQQQQAHLSQQHSLQQQPLRQPHSQSHQILQQQHQQQQQQQQIQMSIGDNTQTNIGLASAASTLSSSNPTVGSVTTSPLMTGQISGVAQLANISSGSTISSMITTSTTTALPSFARSMGQYLSLGAMSNTSYSDGQLPSFTTASTFSQDVPADIIQDLLEISNEQAIQNSIGRSSANSILDEMSSAPTSSDNESFAIQQIQNKLIEEELELFKAQPATPVSNYPPPYNSQRGRFPSPGQNAPPVMSIGSNQVQRHSAPNYAPGSPMHARSIGLQQRVAQLPQHSSEQVRFRLQRQPAQPQPQPQQLHLPSTSSDVVQVQPPPSYQNIDEIINSTVVTNNPTVNLQRSMSESQASPNYGLLNSPLGNGSSGSQLSPGGRIPQPSFSPHGQLTSPLSNQQFSNNSNMGQIGNYQNVQNSQLSPSLSQSSPVGASYSSGGSALIPQMSPNDHNVQGGQVPSGPQSPAWPVSSSHQHRSSLQQQQQNTIPNAQFNVVSAGSRNYPGGVRPNQLPSIRSLPAGSRQSPYAIIGGGGGGGGHNPGNQDMTTVFASSQQQGSLMIHQQQQPQQPQQLQQQYRLSRTISAPGQLPPGLTASGVVSDHTRTQLRARVEAHVTNTGGGNGLGRAGSPSTLVQSQQTLHQLQSQGQGVMAGALQRPQLQQAQQQPPPLAQQQQQQSQPVNIARQQQQQQQSSFQNLDQHPQHLEQNLIRSLASPDGSNWGCEVLGGVPQGNHSRLSPSSRIEDGRGAAPGSGGAKEDKSMLKKLLSQ